MKKSLGLLMLTYLRILAKLQLAKINLLQNLQGKKLIIIGLTASAGKTSTLLAIESALTGELKVKTNSGANSESGIPLNILGFKVTNFSASDWFFIFLTAPLKLLFNWQTYDVYVVEMGVDEPHEPKNMSYLLKILKPQIGIFLNVNLVHSMQFDSTVSKRITGSDRIYQIQLNIAREKARLINSLPTNGIAIINLDDPFVFQTTNKAKAQILSVSNTNSATLKILETKVSPKGFSITYLYQDKKYSLSLPDYVLPEIYAYTLSAAILTGLFLNIPIEKLIKNIQKNLTLPYGRSNVLKGINNTLIIDSSYNSSPLATAEMLNLLSKFPSPRIAVLGDMRELGLQSESAHQQIYKAAKKSADTIISIGPETKKYFGRIKTRSFDTWWTAAEYLKELILQRDYRKATILVKGSQNTIYLEELIKQILDNKRDQKHLCRQSPYWLKVKQDFKINQAN